MARGTTKKEQAAEAQATLEERGWVIISADPALRAYIWQGNAGKYHSYYDEELGQLVIVSKEFMRRQVLV